MPGRTPGEARASFLVPLRRVLSCITGAQLYVPAKRPGDLEAIALSEHPLRLRRGSPPSGSFVGLVIGHQFRVVQDDESWPVSTAKYEYYVVDESGSELLAWHWHPGAAVSYPHLHVSGGAVGHKVHIPTGRVSIEAVVRMLIRDFGVQPVGLHKNDCDDIIDQAERDFIEHRRWHS